MLIFLVAGILIAGYFFKALRECSISKKVESTFCPYCGQEIKHGNGIPEVHAEKGSWEGFRRGNEPVPKI